MQSCCSVWRRSLRKNVELLQAVVDRALLRLGPCV